MNTLNYNYLNYEVYKPDVIDDEVEVGAIYVILKVEPGCYIVDGMMLGKHSDIDKAKEAIDSYHKKVVDFLKVLKNVTLK